MRLSRIILLLQVLLVMIVAGSVGLGQEFPNKPIRLIVNFNPGGTTDLSARIIADMLESRLGVPVVVENRSGGGGAVGVGEVARANKDGYTIGTITASPVTTLYYTQEMSFHPIDDLTFLAQYATTHHPIAVRADAPWSTFEEFVDYARANPGAIRYATAGTLNQAHLTMEQLAMEESIQLTYVPFSEGGSAAMVALLGGHIDATVVSDFYGPLEAGQIKLLAETGDVKIAGYDDVPTLPELGYDFSGVALVGIVAPAGLPEQVRSTLEEALSSVINDPEFERLMADIGVQTTYKDGEAFTEYAARALQNTGEILEALEAE